MGSILGCKKPRSIELEQSILILTNATTSKIEETKIAHKNDLEKAKSESNAFALEHAAVVDSLQSTISQQESQISALQEQHSSELEKVDFQLHQSLQSQKDEFAEVILKSKQHYQQLLNEAEANHQTVIREYEAKLKTQTAQHAAEID